VFKADGNYVLVGFEIFELERKIYKASVHKIVERENIAETF